MEDQGGGGGTKQMNNAYVDTSKAEKAVWLMKCPPLVSLAASTPLPPTPSRLAKVVVSIDPLNSNDDDSPTKVLLHVYIQIMNVWMSCRNTHCVSANGETWVLYSFSVVLINQSVSR